jgi:amino acid transporter
MATLQRVASRWQIVALAINDVVGSGVYLLPAAAAALLGAASLWAVAAAGIAVLTIVLCFAEASSHFDEPGSAYLYARHAFGSLIGFEVGWMTWLARVASVASLSVGFAQALSFVVPATAQGWERALAIAVPLLALTAINLVGVRSGVNAAVVLVVGKLLPLGVFIGTGCFAVSRSMLAGQRPTSEGDFAGAALLLLFAYGGFENTPAAAGEYRNPRRDVPFALLVQIGIVTLIYVAVQWVALGTVPELGASTTPLADGARIFLGGWGGWLLTAGALLTQTAIALPLALSGSFVGLATLSVVARLVTYIGTAAAVPVLRRRPAAAESFRLPGGPAIPAIATVVGLGLLANASWINLAAAGAAALVGVVIYLLRRRAPEITARCGLPPARRAAARSRPERRP